MIGSKMFYEPDDEYYCTYCGIDVPAVFLFQGPENCYYCGNHVGFCEKCFIKFTQFVEHEKEHYRAWKRAKAEKISSENIGKTVKWADPLTTDPADFLGLPYAINDPKDDAGLKELPKSLTQRSLWMSPGIGKSDLHREKEIKIKFIDDFIYADPKVYKAERR
jgi:hypothetical protein